MYSIVVVDDEIFAKKGIKEIINTRSKDFRVIGEANNGLEALEIIEKVIPDVIITDVRMPKIDGLELIRKVTKQFPQIRIVVISGYDDFEYIQQAMRLGAVDYILKPTKIKELLNTLDKICNAIKEESKRNTEKLIFQQNFQKSFVVLREKLFNDIINNKYLSEELLLKELAELNICLNNSMIMVVEVNSPELRSGFENPINLENNYFLEVINMVEKLVRRYGEGFTITIGENRIAAVVCPNSSKYALENSLKALAASIKKEIEDNFQLSAAIGMGNIYIKATDLKKSMDEALIALRQTFFLGRQAIIHINEVEEYEIQREKELDEIATSLILHINPIYKYDVFNDLEKIFDIIECNFKYVDPDRIKEFWIRLLLKICSEIKDYQIINDLFQDCSNVIIKFNSWISLKTYLRDFISSVVAKTEKIERQYRKAIDDCLRYIHMYYNRDLSLQEAAQRANMNCSYFCKLFKDETGMNFKEYITSIRITKAKDYLRYSNERIHDIAAIIGYNDPKYFNVVFKKSVGVTPSQFREKTEKQ